MAATKKAKPKDTWAKTCGCLEAVNKALERDGENTRVDTAVFLNFETGNSRCLPRLATVKRDTKVRKSMRTIIPTYCPFCGKKYPK